MPRSSAMSHGTSERSLIRPTPGRGRRSRPQGRPHSSHTSSEALADLANALYNDPPKTGSVTIGRFTYLNVLRGSAVCAFVRRYYMHHHRRTPTDAQVLNDCRNLLSYRVFSVIDEGRHSRSRLFMNDASCLCRLRRVRKD
eukprot:IDg2053t1